MSENVKHALGLLFAGVIAFGGVGAAAALSPTTAAPAHHDSDADSTAEPTELSTALLGRWQAPAPANPDAFVEFTQYGLWFASDGCNGLDGTWIVDDDGALQVQGSKVMTQVWCDNVNIPMVVSDAVSAEVGNDQVTLTTSSGDDMVLDRTRTESVSLVGTWAPEDGASGPEVTFSSENEVTATDGCNGSFGEWSLSPELEYGSTSSMAPLLQGRFSAGLLGYTQVGCPGNAERDFLGILGDATQLGFIDPDRVLIAHPSTKTDDPFGTDSSVILKRQS
ncbi:hypothetical protein [Leucobacter japonicus]|uniref:hypothetical protein n=1 Tax=Leucobacter japonicus TaxID=1461259 RepID=UPI0006A7EDE2|nr:hypothetical protein [Leucobacter japonicus]